MVVLIGTPIFQFFDVIDILGGGGFGNKPFYRKNVLASPLQK